MNETFATFFNLHPDALKTFEFLGLHGPTTIGILAKQTGIKRPSLYNHVRQLCEKGLVTQSQKGGVKVFYASSPEKVMMQYDQQIKKLTEHRGDIANALQDMYDHTTKQNLPRVQVYEGPQQMRLLARELLLYRDIESQSCWPIMTMIEILGEDFFREFNIERIARNISIQAVWPTHNVPNLTNYPYVAPGEEFLREIKIAPSHMDFSMGYWIFENKVAFVSSRSDNFGYLIESKDHAQLMRQQFMLLWEHSTLLDISEEKSKGLYKKMMSH